MELLSNYIPGSKETISDLLPQVLVSELRLGDAQVAPGMQGTKLSTCPFCAGIHQHHAPFLLDFIGMGLN